MSQGTKAVATIASNTEAKKAAEQAGAAAAKSRAARERAVAAKKAGLTAKRFAGKNKAALIAGGLGTAGLAAGIAMANRKKRGQDDG